VPRLLVLLSLQLLAAMQTVMVDQSPSLAQLSSPYRLEMRAPMAAVLRWWVQVLVPSSLCLVMRSLMVAPPHSLVSRLATSLSLQAMRVLMEVLSASQSVQSSPSAQVMQQLLVGPLPSLAQRQQPLVHWPGMLQQMAEAPHSLVAVEFPSLWSVGMRLRRAAVRPLRVPQSSA
jgi:hypothetical protein